MNPLSHAAGPREYLAGLEQFGIKLGLTTMAALSEALGHPERAFRSIHIAGTNGKGSTAAFVDEILRAAGHRIGRYTSPHLVHLEERFHIDGAPVEAARLDEALNDIQETVARLQHTGSLDVHPTYFEATTMAAFLLFARAGVDASVLEVGLGGRLDATNVVVPLASAVTSVARDHEAHLGSSLAAIAGEKAAIAKPGVPLVMGDMPAEAREVVAAACRERGAPLVDAVEGSRLETCIEHGATVLTLRTPAGEYGPLRLALRGEHQARNALVAVRLVETVAAHGLHAAPAAIAAGLERTRWPGRLDLRTLPDGRRVLVDGAHNPAGSAALARYVEREWPGGLPIVFGAMQDKDLRGMLEALAPVARPFVLTRAPGARAAEIERLAEVARAVGVSAETAAEPGTALNAGWRLGPTIVVAGSLYLAGAVLECLPPSV